MDVRNNRALVAFCQFQDIWVGPKLLQEFMGLNGPFRGWGTYCEWLRISCCGRFLIASSAKSTAEDGVEQLKIGLKEHWRFSGMHRSAVRGHA
eukprot:353813-Chlamydomonas_euryale.AAC.3